MTNLKLPSLSYENLISKVPESGRHKSLGYKTVAWQEDGTVFVQHHDTIIATLFERFIRLSTGGWDSKTTAHRLNAILHDNGVQGNIVFRQETTSYLSTTGVTKHFDSSNSHMMAFDRPLPPPVKKQRSTPITKAGK